MSDNLLSSVAKQLLAEGLQQFSQLRSVAAADRQIIERTLQRTAALQGRLLVNPRDVAASFELKSAVNTLAFLKAKYQIEGQLLIRQWFNAVTERATGALLDYAFGHAELPMS